MKKISKIVFWIIVMLFAGLVGNEAFKLHTKHKDIQYGQQWMRHYNENPFKKIEHDTLNILDVKEGYVQYYIKYKSGVIDTQSCIREWFDNGFYTKIKQ